MQDIKQGFEQQSANSQDADPKKTYQPYPEEILRALEKIKRGSVDLLPEGGMIEKLVTSRRTGKRLKIKAGFDPTAPDLHLGHLVLLRKLRHFQECGHEVQFLIGDFTALIGDPSGRSQLRKRMTATEVEENARTYREQVFRVLDRNKTEVMFNSDWFCKMSIEELLDLTARYNVARLLERDDFSKRYRKGQSISLIEFIYPLIQGYDSVVMKSDVEVGGSDQKFNLLVGRELQSQYGQPPQTILTVPLLVGLDGERKMSKSLGNAIGINEQPFAIFAKLMSVSDEMMWDYFILLTDISQQEISQLRLDPFEAKKILAAAVSDDLHGKGAGEEARRAWEKEKGKESRQQMILPPDTAEYLVEKGSASHSLVDIIVEAGLEESKSAVRRLIKSGSIKIGKQLQPINDLDYKLHFPGEYALKIGKKRYLKIRGME